MKQILIDAIKLRKDIPKKADYYEALAWIDEAEEVDAIPIEWLEKCKDRYILCCTIIDDIIEEWREQNEG